MISYEIKKPVKLKRNAKTIMIVGAGRGQLPAILTAKRMGLRTVAIDKKTKAIGMEHADIALPIDIVDTPAVVKAAKEYKVIAVMTMQSDVGLPTVGAVTDSLGLIGISRKIALLCNNKYKMRILFYYCGVSSPKIYKADNFAEFSERAAAIGYPCIAKPIDSSGSRGVTKVTNSSQLERAYEDALSESKMRIVCIDEFIDGMEVGAQAFSFNGHCVKILIHNDTITLEPYYVPIGHSFPTKMGKRLTQKVEGVVSDAVETLGFSNSPFNVDVIIGKDNVPYVLEVSPRIGATCLPELVEYYTGINWVEATILALLGDTPDLQNKRNMPCAGLILDSPSNGKLVDYHIPKSVYQAPYLLNFEMEKRRGDLLSQMHKGTDRVGKIITRGRGWRDAEYKAHWIKSQIKLEIS